MRKEILAAFAVVAVLVSGSTRASDEDQKRVSVQAGNVEVGATAPKSSSVTVRVSKLLGRNIQNARGEDVGEIKDIVLDPASGRVRYAAVTYGGLLGVGNKMFAVPFEAFEWRENLRDTNEPILVLNVTPERLEGQQGFDEDHWPDFADRKFTMDLDRRYGIDRKARSREGRVDINLNKGGLEIDVRPKADRDN